MNLTEINEEYISTEMKNAGLFKRNPLRAAYSFIQDNSITNTLNIKNNLSAKQLLQRHQSVKTNLNETVQFVTSKRNWKAITAAGQFENLKNTMNTLDKRLREIHKSVTMGDKSVYNALRAELFSVNADIDALKQKLKALVK